MLYFLNLSEIKYNKTEISDNKKLKLNNTSHNCKNKIIIIIIKFK